MFSEEGRELTLFKLGQGDTCVISAALFVLQEIILLGFDKRLAKYLIEASKNGNSIIKTTQEVIATDVNSAREVVARMLKQFELEGLVELKRGSIEIKNLEGLQKII